MHARKLGDIPLDDYLRLARPRKRWSKPLKALASVAVCALCMAAGVYGPWPGKGASRLSLQDALAILNRAPAEEWEHKLGVYAVHANVTRALDALRLVAEQPGRAGENASHSLCHITRRGLSHIKTLAGLTTHADIQQQSLQLITSDLPPR